MFFTGQNALKLSLRFKFMQLLIGNMCSVDVYACECAHSASTDVDKKSYKSSLSAYMLSLYSF